MQIVGIQNMGFLDCGMVGLTSNDIIAGNGRILSVHEYCEVKYLSKNFYFSIHELFFLFPSCAV